MVLDQRICSRRFNNPRKITVETKKEYIAKLVSKVGRCSRIIKRYKKYPDYKNAFSSAEAFEFIIHAPSPSAWQTTFEQHCPNFNTLALVAENAKKIMKAAQAELKVLQK